MLETNKNDHLLNAISDGDNQMVLRLAESKNIKPEHFQRLISEYKENISNVAVSIDYVRNQLPLLGYTKNQYTETAAILARNADDKTLQQVKELTSNEKTTEQHFDEEDGYAEPDRKSEKINQVINNIVTDELKARKYEKLAQNDPLLHAIKGSDKYKAVEKIEQTNPKDIKSHHLAAAIDEYYKGSSNETIPSLVRSEEKSVMKALIGKASNNVLEENRQYKIKEAELIEHGNLEAGSIAEKIPAEYIDVKEVIAELNRRESGKSESVAVKQTSQNIR